MIEIILQDFLMEKLNIPVFMEEDPSRSDDQYILLEKTGETEANQVLTATMAIQSYSCSRLADSALLNQEVKTAMKSFSDETTNIFRVRLAGNYNFTDTETKKYRYQAVYEITYQEV